MILGSKCTELDLKDGTTALEGRHRRHHQQLLGNPRNLQIMFTGEGCQRVQRGLVVLAHVRLGDVAEYHRDELVARLQGMMCARKIKQILLPHPRK